MQQICYTIMPCQRLNDLIDRRCWFIGSVTLSYFNKHGIDDIIIVDSFKNNIEKWKNLTGKKFVDLYSREKIFDILSNTPNIDFIIHLGACTDTTNYDLNFLLENNFNFSKILCNYATENGIPFIYASSAATYGLGEEGFVDSLNDIYKLKPVNPYGFSKQLFDLWFIKNSQKPIKWAALKFFNVYGPNEYHKGNMASMVYQMFTQLKRNGVIKLFKSNCKSIADGEQKRDFIYVEDIAEIIFHIFQSGISNDLYNVGTGEAHSFNELAELVIAFSGITGKIEYIDMPDSIKECYQNYTAAHIKKILSKKVVNKFTPLVDGVEKYIKNYLQDGITYCLILLKYYLKSLNC